MAGVVGCVGAIAWRGSHWWAVLGMAGVGHGGRSSACPVCGSGEGRSMWGLWIWVGQRL